ncbi:MAG: hypothetical protein ACE5J2_05445 [Nitrososphaerales archaeon]
MKKKKAIVGIGLGVIMLTSIVGAMSVPTDRSKIGDIENKRQQKLEIIARATVSWDKGLIDDEQFIAAIEESTIDTDALREEYLSLNLNPMYDDYKRLSIDSLDQQKQAFLKLKEYLQTDDPEVQQSILEEYDEHMTRSIKYRTDAAREIES